MIVLNPEEVTRLLAAVDRRSPFGDRDYYTIVLLLRTGLRVSELIALDHFHVSANGAPRQALHLPAAVTKYARSRTIPLNEAARDVVAGLIRFNQARGFSTAPDTPLLVTRRHERVSVRLIQRMVEGLREKAQLDVPATPHALRRTFSTRLVKATGNLCAAQVLLGHRHIGTTVRAYVDRPGRDELAAAVAMLT